MVAPGASLGKQPQIRASACLGGRKNQINCKSQSRTTITRRLRRVT